LNLRIAAGYLVFAGVAGLAVPLLRIGPDHAEFRAQSLGFRVGAYTRGLIFSAASVLAGIGLFEHHDWARKLALGLLIIGTIPAANAFAWGFSTGRPTRRVSLISQLVVAAWNACWFYVIYRLAL
jgi:hypothetical protein